MKISSINSPNFNSRHIDFRKADDIAHHVNRSFPMFKPTYALCNWKTLNCSDDEHIQLRRDFSRKYMGRVMAMRDEYMSEYSQNQHYIDLMDCVDYRKYGNCHESAFITLGTLFANGFEKSKKVSPRLEISGIDKKTKKVIVWKSFPIDHTCVMTSMNNPKREAVDKSIIIDSWLNKSMSVPEAKREYFKFISKKELARDLYEVQEELKRKMRWRIEDGCLIENEDFNINNYDFKYEIHFVSDELFVPSEIKQFSEDVREKFPRLIMDYLA